MFLVHDADGHTSAYVSLALRLDSKHPVYALEPHRKANHPILHTRIEEMAAFYIGKIREVQPRGPYLLGGLCAGGLIAFEIARQLERQGEQVPMVALMDASDAAVKGQSVHVAGQRLSRLASVFDHDKGVSTPRRLLIVSSKSLRKVGSFTRYLTQSRSEIIREYVIMQLFSLHLKLGLRVADVPA